MSNRYIKLHIEKIIERIKMKTDVLPEFIAFKGLIYEI